MIFDEKFIAHVDIPLSLHAVEKKTGHTKRNREIIKLVKTVLS